MKKFNDMVLKTLMKERLEKSVLQLVSIRIDSSKKLIEGVNVGISAHRYSPSIIIVQDKKVGEDIPLSIVAGITVKPEEELLIWKIMNDISTTYLKERLKEINKRNEQCLPPLKTSLEDAFNRSFEKQRIDFKFNRT